MSGRVVSDIQARAEGERLYIRCNIQLIQLRKSKLCVGNSSAVKIYIIRPKPGPVAKNATPRPSGWESNPRPLDY